MSNLKKQLISTLTLQERLEDEMKNNFVQFKSDVESLRSSRRIHNNSLKDVKKLENEIADFETKLASLNKSEFKSNFKTMIETKYGTNNNKDLKYLMKELFGSNSDNENSDLSQILNVNESDIGMLIQDGIKTKNWANSSDLDSYPSLELLRRHKKLMEKKKDTSNQHKQTKYHGEKRENHFSNAPTRFNIGKLVHDNPTSKIPVDTMFRNVRRFPKKKQ